MHCAVYAHPEDLRDLAAHGGMARLRELGFRRVAVASAYHAGRWLTPWSRAGAVRFLEDGVVHFRPRADYGPLRPRTSRQVESSGPSPLEAAIHTAREAGLETSAWTVLNHNSRLGRAHPDACVENALGDRYTYALCPARAEVLDYDAALVGDLARHEGLDLIELEALGFMGHKHGSHHDKASFVSEPYGDFLLSHCFCTACQRGIDRAGGDARASRARVAAAIRRHLADGDALAPARSTREAAEARLEAELGESFAALLRHRLAVHHAVLDRMREVVAGRCRIAVHVHFDPLTTGSQMGIALRAVVGRLDEAVVTHYGDPPDRIATMWRNQPTGEVPTRASIWPKAPQYESDADLRAVRAVVAERGGVGLGIYHLGLLPWPTIERVARVLAAP
jgi:hypothetical protein